MRNFLRLQFGRLLFLLFLAFEFACGGEPVERQESAITPVNHWHVSAGVMEYGFYPIRTNGAFILNQPLGNGQYQYIRQRASTKYTPGAVDCNITMQETVQFGIATYRNTGIGICHVTWNGQYITWGPPAGAFEIYPNGAAPPFPDLHEQWNWVGWTPNPLNMLAYVP